MDSPRARIAIRSHSLTRASLALIAGICVELGTSAYGAPTATVHRAQVANRAFVYIGTHGSAPFGPPRGNDSAQSPQPAHGEAQGIYAARLDLATGHLTSLGLAVELERATWLTVNPKIPVLYSVADSGSGFRGNSLIHSLAIDATTGALGELNAVDAGGIDATHLDIDPASGTLFSANHGSGSVTALPIDPDGRLRDVVARGTDAGTGPHPRQKSPQAHGVAVDPTHHWVLVADFGADRIFVYRYNRKDQTLKAAATAFTALPPGSGPRHLLFHPAGKYLLVDTELSAELRSYRWDAHTGGLQLAQTVSTYPANYSGEKSAAELRVSRDGRFVYVSLRGDQDCLIVYSMNSRDGTLQEIQRIASQGKTPWSFAIDPSGRWMLVTHEASNSVAVLSVDPSTGRLAATGESLSIPRPVTVAFYPN